MFLIYDEFQNMAGNVPPLLVSCEVRNFLFSVKDKNSCEMKVNLPQNSQLRETAVGGSSFFKS
jgi:hypothetical protein